MNISTSGATLQAAQTRSHSAAVTVSASGWVGSSAGPLSTKELSALRAAVGYDFAWPPTSDGPIPLAALQIAGQHADELAAHMKLQELTANDLDKFVAAGMIDAAGAARGAALLAQGSSPTAAADAAAQVAQVSPPVSGSIAANRSLYL